jgi:hypothetical protein
MKLSFGKPKDIGDRPRNFPVEVLKDMWQIDTEPAPREAAPKNVVTDIYSTGSSSVPRRSRSSRRRRSD